MPKKIIYQVNEVPRGNRRNDYTVVFSAVMPPYRASTYRARSRLILGNNLSMLEVFNIRQSEPLTIEAHTIKLVGNEEEIRDVINKYLARLFAEGSKIRESRKLTTVEAEQQRIKDKNW